MLLKKMFLFYFKQSDILYYSDVQGGELNFGAQKRTKYFNSLV